jgi:hypothetical protein
MLPFLKRDRQASGISTTVYRKPDYEQSEEHEGLAACSKDLIEGIQTDDKQKVAAALKAAFQILDSEPHEEGEHLDEQEKEEEQE